MYGPYISGFGLREFSSNTLLLKHIQIVDVIIDTIALTSTEIYSNCTKSRAQNAFALAKKDTKKYRDRRVRSERTREAKRAKLAAISRRRDDELLALREAGSYGTCSRRGHYTQ